MQERNMRNSLGLVLLLVTTVTGQGVNTGIRNNAGFPQTANMNTNFGFPAEVGRNLGMTLAQAQVAPTIEDMCMQASMRPAMTKGGLSDIVGNEVARRANFLLTFPQMAGTGKWGCAASFYAARNPPSELGNLFGDLIDTTGCMDFTCNPISGPKPINTLMNALLMGSMLNNMNSGQGMGLFPAQQPVHSQPVNPGLPGVPATNPALPAVPVVTQPAVPASPPTAFNQPSNQTPHIINQAATPQISNQAQPSQILAQQLMDPIFQEQLMLILTKMLESTRTVKG